MKINAIVESLALEAMPQHKEMNPKLKSVYESVMLYPEKSDAFFDSVIKVIKESDEGKPEDKKSIIKKITDFAKSVFTTIVNKIKDFGMRVYLKFAPNFNKKEAEIEKGLRVLGSKELSTGKIDLVTDVYCDNGDVYKSLAEWLQKCTGFNFSNGSVTDVSEFTSFYVSGGYKSMSEDAMDRAMTIKECSTYTDISAKSMKNVVNMYQGLLASSTNARVKYFAFKTGGLGMFVGGTIDKSLTSAVTELYGEFIKLASKCATTVLKSIGAYIKFAKEALKAEA